MNRIGLRKVLGRGTSFLVALTLSVSGFFTQTNIMNISASELQYENVAANKENDNRKETGAKASKFEAPTPRLLEANEVEWSEETTARVYTARGFLVAYTNPTITRIELTNDIDVSSLQREIRAYKLSRSLQIDGNDFTIKGVAGGIRTDETFFYLERLPQGQTETMHLKNVKIHAKGTNFIDAWGTRSEGWQLILDDTRVHTWRNPNKHDEYEGVKRVARFNMGHIFLRNDVYMQSTAENFYAGQITVEPNANVYGEIHWGNDATWWFPDANTSVASVDGTVNIGENAQVELTGVYKNGDGHPPIYGHWTDINVHQGATLKGTKRGRIYKFSKTPNVAEKHINVYEGATLEGTSTGGSHAVVEDYNSIGHIYAAPGSTINLSSASSKPVINLKQKGSSFVLDRPGAYDLRNNLNRSRAKLVEIGTEAVFKIIDSDISVWDGSRSARDFTEEADASWVGATVISNNRGLPVAGTIDQPGSNPSIWDAWDATKFSRIAGESGEPTLTFGELTDADKSYVVHATVHGRPAGPGTVHVRVTNDKDDTVQEGVTDKDGNFIYRALNDEFFNVGTTYTASGYRGSEKWATQDPQATATVRDATPPKPVTVEEDVYHTAGRIRGTDGEPGAVLSATRNGEPIDFAEEVVVGADGTWSFDLPANVILEPKDIIQIFLTDAAGNTTPAVDTPYKDAIFAAATKVEVQQDTRALELNLNTPIVYNRNESVSNERFLTDVNRPEENPLLVELTSNFTGRDDNGNPVVDLNTVGAYVVIVNGKDRTGREARRAVVVLVKDDDTIIDTEHGTMITAHSFIIQVSGLPNANFVELAHAQAWNTSTGRNLTVEFRGDRPDTSGDYLLTFEAMNNEGSVVGIHDKATAHIYDVLNEEDKEGLNGHFFAVGTSQLQPDIFERVFIELGGIKAYDLTTMPPTELQGVRVASPMPTVSGRQQITFETASGKTRITVPVLVFIDTEAIALDTFTQIGTHEDPPRRSYGLNAYDFTLPVSLINEDNFFLHARAEGWDITDLANPFEVPIHIISDVDLKDMKSNQTYDVAFKISDPRSQLAVPVKATIIDTNMTLEAHNAAVSIEEIQNANVNDVLRYAGVVGTTENKVGWFPIEGIEGRLADVTLEISGVDMGKLKSVQRGQEEPVRITIVAKDETGDSTETEVDIYIFDEVNREEGFAINAHDFTIPLGLVLGDNARDNFVDYAEARGYNIADIPNNGRLVGNVSLEIVTSIPTTPGFYSTTFRVVGRQTNITVDTDIIDTNILLDAENVVMSLADAKRTSSAEMILRADVEVDTENPGAEITEVTIDARDIARLTSLQRGQEEPITITIKAADSIGDYTSTEIQVYVYDSVNVDDGYAMNAHDFSIPRALVSEENFKKYADVKGYNIALMEPGPVADEAIVLDGALPTTTGTHRVTFRIRDTHTTITVEATITETNITLEANDVVMSVEEAKATNEADMLRRSSAKATSTNERPQTTLTINEDQVVKLTRLQRGQREPITLIIQATDETGDITTKPVNVYVYDGVSQDRTESIIAEDFVVELSAISGLSEDEYRQLLIELAKAQAYDITSLPPRAIEGITVRSDRLTEEGPNQAVTFQSPNGAAEVTVLAHVIDSRDPILYANTRIIYDKGINKTDAEFLADVQARIERGWEITSDFSSVVDLNTVGVYFVQIKAGDGGDKASNIVRTTVIVKDGDTVVDEDHDAMIRANNFSSSLSAVPDADFVALADAKGWLLSTGAPLVVELESEKPRTGGEHPVRFRALVTRKTVTATITDDVDPVLSADARVDYDKNISKTPEEFLIDAHAVLNEEGDITSNFADVVDLTQVGAYIVTLQGVDTAGNESNIVQTIVIVKDDDTVIDERRDTMIVAYDFELDLSEVPAADFVALAKAKAWLMSTGAPLGVVLESQKPTTGGTHLTTFNANGVRKTVDATITDLVAPILTVNERVTYDKGVSRSDAQFLEDAKASLDKAGTITSDFTTAVDLNKVGVYFVTLQGEDTAGNKSNVVRTTVLVKDSDTVIDEDKDTMMRASDFTVNLSEVPSANFVALAGAEAWTISTGAPVEVTLATAKPTTGGEHSVTFNAGEASKTVQATVTDNVLPVLTAERRMTYDKGTSRSEAQFFEDAKASLDKAGTITSDFTTAVDLNKVGVYFVTLQGEDNAGNKSNVVRTTVIVKDGDTVIDEDKDMMMRASDFTVNLSEVPSADFVALAEAEAWTLSTGARVEVTLATAKPTTGGDHPVTFNAGEASKTVQATVNDNVDPILNAEARVTYDKGVSRSEEQFLEDAKASLDKAGTITSDFATAVDLSKVGVYFVTLQGEDNAGNNSNVVRTTVIVKDADTVIDEDKDTMMRASDFTVNLSEVPGADFVALAEAEAWTISTGAPVEVKLTSEKPTTGGEHSVTFNAGEASKTVQATVTDNVDPILNAEARVTYDKGVSRSQEQFLEDAKASLDKAGTITSDFATAVDLNKVGVYFVTLQGEDTAGNKSNVVRTTVMVKDGDTVIDEDKDTMMRAHDFAISLSEVPGADFVALAEAEAWTISTGAPVGVKLTSEKPTTGGEHSVTFNAGEASKTVQATVTDNVDPILNAEARVTYDKGVSRSQEQFLEDAKASLDKAGTITSDFTTAVDLNKVGVYFVTLRGEDNAGNKSNVVRTTVIVKDADTVIDEDKDTMMRAHDFAINLSEVPNADFVALGEAEAWTISTGAPVEVTVTSAKPTTGGLHPVTFNAGEASKTVQATVTDNVLPVLTAEARVTYDKGVSRSQEQFLEDAKASLDKAGTITSDFTTAVDLNKVGVYFVTLQGEDNAGNKSNVVKTTVIVKDGDTVIDEDKDTMMRASDFTVNLSEVPSANFVALAGAEAWTISTGAPVEVTLASAKPTTGGEHPVTFNAGEASKSVQATVTDNVLPVLAAEARVTYDKGTSRSEVQFFEDAKASLDKAGTITSDFTTAVDLNKVGVYFVTLQGEDNAGNKSNVVKTTVIVKDGDTVIDEDKDTMMRAHDFAINLSEVPGADFVALAEAEAWTISTGAPVEVTLATAKPTTGGEHSVTFTAGEVSKTVQATVTDNVLPVLTAEARVTYDKGVSRSEAQFLEDAKASLDKAGTITSDFTTAVDLNKVGVYFVTLQGEDNAGNKSNVVRTTVIVKDSDTIIDEDRDIMMRAHDFAISLSEVPGADFVSLAGAEAWKISTGAPVEVTLASAKPTTGGEHPVTFNAGEASKTVQATVTDNVLPVLTAEVRVTYDKGVSRSDEQFLADAKARLDKAGTITSDFATAVDLNKVGVYIVTLQGADNAGNMSNSVKTSVLVKDENTEVRDDTMIVAYDFTAAVQGIEDADFVALAQAEAWEISTGERVAVRLNTEKPTTVGEYLLLFSANEANKTIVAKITDDVLPILTAEGRVTYDKGTSRSEEQFFEDANARLDKAGTITSDFTTALDLNKVGVYFVTLEGEDNAGNKSNVVRTTVIVKDGDTVIDEDKDTMLRAHDFALNLSEVPAADFVALAEAEAWTLSTGASLEVALVSEKPTTTGTHTATFNAGEVSKDVKAIVTTTILTFHANHVRFSLADFKKFKSADTLAEETLRRSKAKAYIKDTGEELSPLAADVSTMLEQEVKGGETFDVHIYYPTTGEFSDVEWYSTAQEGVMIKVTIERPFTLPITGENMTLTLIGLATFISSLGLLVLGVFYRKKNKANAQNYKLTRE